MNAEVLNSNAMEYQENLDTLLTSDDNKSLFSESPEIARQSEEQFQCYLRSQDALERMKEKVTE